MYTCDGIKMSEKDFLEKILDTTQTMMFWKDAERRFLGVNKAFLAFYGFESQDELIGKTDEDMGWHSNPDPFEDDEWKVLHQGIRTHMVHGTCLVKGEEREILASKSPVYYNGSIVGLVGSFMDVTEQFRQKDKIEELTRKLDGIPGGIAIYKRFYGELQCISVNQFLAQQLGTIPSALIGRGMKELLQDYMVPDSCERFFRECQVLQGTHRQESGTYQFRNQQTGRAVWLHISCQLVREPGDEELIYCAYTNVDKLVHYEDEIHKRNLVAQGRYTRAMAMLNEDKERNLMAKGHYNFSQNKVLEYTTYSDDVYKFKVPATCDEAFEGLMGLSYLDSDYQMLKETMHRENIIRGFEQGNDHINIRYRRILQGREPLWISLVLQIFVMPDTGDIEGISYAYNITEMMLKETIITRLGKLGYDELGLIYTGSRFWRCYQYVERQQWLHSMTQTHGDWDDEIVRYANENVIPEQREHVLKAISVPVIVSNLASSEVYTCTNTVRLPNGTIRQKELKFSYLNDIRETLFYCMSDITDQFVQENEQIKELAEAKHETERANNAKAAFFATMSHDMRTPLNGVIGYTGLALESTDMAEIKEYLSRIRISGELLVALINDVLDFGKFVVKKITLKQEPLKIQTFCNQVDTIIRPLAMNKNIIFLVDNHLTYDGFVVEDPLRLQQLFVNLLSNSVKFTKSGGRVDISLTGTDAGDYIDSIITIKDTGIGMSKDFLPMIFDPYTQEERRSASKTVGTGLGMAIVKHIVDLMGGTISVESEIDVGTTFTVHLALKKYMGNDVPAVDLSLMASLDVLKGKNVLLCEDNELNAEIAQLILRHWGIRTIWVENGRQAVDKIKNNIAYYDLVLMDRRMPVMDGLEATKAIRMFEAGKHSHIPIIAMTGDVDEDSIQSCLDAGMDAHVGKPINKEELARVMKSALLRRQ